MPGKLKAKIVAGRHLPVMDRASDLTDAFVEVKFGNTTFKTDVCPKSLNPQWNSEWFKFEVDDEDLQDEPLQITVLDHDTYSANDAIGKVYIDIDPLLCSEAASVISGWFPIYDTIHGIENNSFHSSYPTSIPRCYRVAMVHGFVEELVVNEDPEYQWIDRIRTPRASNEARQRLISLMSGELQRKIGLKVLEMGGNAVVGYLQCFDLEGESGLVVRAIGTACTLDKLSSGAAASINTHMPVFTEDLPSSSGPPTPFRALPTTSSSPPPFSPSKPCSRQSSSSDTDLSLTPKTGMGSGGSAGKEAGPLKTLLRQQTQTALEQREFPFFTLTSFPPGFLVHVGGVVSARSVKLLDRIHNPDEPETRDAWWEEIRQEIKSHAKALGCHAVVGYSESTSICEEVCILSASGTAAILNPRSFFFFFLSKVPDVLFTTIDLPPEAAVTGQGCLIQARLCRLKKKAQGEVNATAISNLLPFMEYELHTQLMNKLKLRSMNALFGLRIQISVGENMLLGLASATGVYLTALPAPGGIQIAGKTPGDLSNEHHILAIQKRINDTIAKNKELYQINPPELTEEAVGSPIPEPRQRSRLFRSHSESSDELSELDLSHGKKDAFVLEIDDTDAVEDIHSLLTDAPTPTGFYSCNTEIMPGIYNWTSGLQMFTSVRVFRLSNANLTNQGLNKIFTDLCENLLKSLYFKLRSMIPCCLCHLNFTVAVPEEELIQVTVIMNTVSLENEEQLQFPLELCAESTSANNQPSAKIPAPSVDYGSFADRCSTWLELLRLKAHTIRRGSVKTSRRTHTQTHKQTRTHARIHSHTPPCMPSVTVVKMTPLSFLPGTRIVKYLGIINMFFIRETTSLREEGGVSGFLHSFIAEVFAMVRAHVAALGGNAVVSYSMKECVFMENPNKNQSFCAAQCLINVSGDAVIFVRDTDQEATPAQMNTGQTCNSGTDGAT
uniref:C2 calcium dependent domain containing 5 n=1 Tax=Myripristis murdjan TaxID=586833 RepID=A0A667YU59_9TELE